MGLHNQLYLDINLDIRDRLKNLYSLTAPKFFLEVNARYPTLCKGFEGVYRS